MGKRAERRKRTRNLLRSQEYTIGRLMDEVESLQDDVQQARHQPRMTKPLILEPVLKDSIYGHVLERMGQELGEQFGKKLAEDISPEQAALVRHIAIHVANGILAHTVPTFDLKTYCHDMVADADIELEFRASVDIHRIVPARVIYNSRAFPVDIRDRISDKPPY